jgi:hypothetical protein
MRASITRVLSAMTLIMLSSRVAGDSPSPPSTYQVVSADQKFVFVMVPPYSLDNELKFWNESFGEKVRQIRSEHGVSGMYRNDGTSEPLWTVSWYAFGTEIYSDGVHLVRHGPWASKLSDEGISFFARDRLLRTYLVSDLVKDKSKLKRSVSHFEWSADQRLDDSMLRYTLLTVDRRCYVFDVTTGEILSITSRRKLP